MSSHLMKKLQKVQETLSQAEARVQDLEQQLLPRRNDPAKQPAGLMKCFDTTSCITQSSQCIKRCMDRCMGSIKKCGALAPFAKYALRDAATQTMIVYTGLTILFYKQFYNEYDVIKALLSNQDTNYAVAIVSSIVLAPFFHYLLSDESLSIWAVLKKIFLIEAGELWFEMARDYVKRSSRTDSFTRLSKEELLDSAGWVHGLRSKGEQLNLSLASEQSATLVVLSVECFALFLYLQNPERDQAHPKATPALKRAILTSLFTMALQRVRLDWVSWRSPFGQVAFKENVPQWRNKQLNYFPVVSGCVLPNSRTSLGISFFRALENAAVLIATVLFHASFATQETNLTFIQKLGHFQGPLFLIGFPLATSCLDEKIENTSGYLPIFNGIMSFPSPLIMPPQAVSPAAAVSARKYYLCRCMHLAMALCIAVSRIQKWKAQLPVVLVWSLLVVLAAYVVLLLALVVASYTCNIHSIQAPQLLCTSLDVAIAIDEIVLPRPLTKFRQFFQSAYDMYQISVLGNEETEQNLETEFTCIKKGLTAEVLQRMVLKIPDQNKIKKVDTSRNTDLMNTAKGGAAMGALLAKCPEAEEIHISGTDLTAEGLQAMVSRIPEQSKIKKAVLSSNTDLMKTEEGGAAMGALLAKSPEAEEIHMMAAGLTVEGLKGMVPKMPDQNKIKKVVTSCNTNLMKTAEGGAAVGAFLAKCPEAEELDLSSTDLTAEGLQGMVPKIPDQNKIKKVDIQTNMDLLATEEDGAAMGAFLAKCPEVEEINMTFAGLTAESLQGMVPRVPEQNKIKKVVTVNNFNLLATAEAGAAMGAFLAKCLGAEEILMSSTGLTAEGLHGMVSRIPEQSKIKKVITSGNADLMKTAEGGAAMGALLAKCPEAEEILMNSTGLTAEGLQGMVPKTPDQNKIKKVDTSSNFDLMKTAEGGAAMGAFLAKCPEAEEILMKFTGLTAESLQGMVPKIPDQNKIKKVDTSWNSDLMNTAEGGAAMGAFLAKCPEAEEFDMTFTGLTAEGLQGMVSRTPEQNKIKKVIISSNTDLLQTAEGGAAMGAFLAKCAEAEELEMTSAGLTAEGLQGMVPKIPEQNKIRKVVTSSNTDLMKTAEGGAAMGAFLAKCPEAEEIHMTSTGLTDEGLQGMVSRTQEQNKIKKVDTSRNSDLMKTAEGGEVMGAFLAKCPEAKEFDISETGLTAEGLHGMVSRIPKQNNLKVIWAGASSPVYGIAIELFQSLSPNLQIKGWSAPIAGSVSLFFLDMQRVSSVYITGREEQEMDLAGEALPKCLEAEEICMTFNALTAEGLQGMVSRIPEQNKIKKVVTSRNRDLMKTAEGGAAMGAFLAKCPEAEEFDISETGLTAEGLHGMVSRTAEQNKIKKVDISSDTDLMKTAEGGAAIGAFLAKFPEAEEIHMKRTGLTVEGLKGMVPKMPDQNEIKKVDTSSNFDLMKTAEGGAAMGSFLAKCPNAEEILMNSTGLTVEGLKGMVPKIPDQNKIKKVGISRNTDLMKTAEGGAAMGAFLAKCPEAEEFDMTFTDLTAEGLQGMVSRTPDQNKIKKAVLSSNTDLMETAEGGAAMGALLAKSPEAEEIHMKGTDLTAEGLHGMVPKIPDQNRIKKVDSSWNRDLMKTAEGVAATGALLAKCPQAEEVDISCTGLTTESLHGLVSRIPEKNKIKKVVTSQNRDLMKTAEGGAAMGAFLAKCPEAEELDLSRTELTAEGLQGMVPKIPEKNKIKKVVTGLHPMYDDLVQTAEGQAARGVFLAKCPEAEI